MQFVSERRVLWTHLAIPLYLFSRLFVISFCVTSLSNRFSSYTLYMHEYSITTHEQHASTLPFSLPPHSFSSGSSDYEFVFIPRVLFWTCRLPESGLK